MEIWRVTRVRRRCLKKITMNTVTTTSKIAPNKAERTIPICVACWDVFVPLDGIIGICAVELTGEDVNLAQFQSHFRK